MAADAVARTPPPRSVAASRGVSRTVRRVASAPQRRAERAAQPLLMAELYRLGCLVDPMLAAATDDDVLLPDDVPTADPTARAAGHRPRSAAVLSRVPQSADPRPQTPDANGRPQTAATLRARGGDADSRTLRPTTPPEPGMVGLSSQQQASLSTSSQQYRTATFGRRRGGSDVWVWPHAHRSCVQPVSEWRIEPAEPPPAFLILRAHEAQQRELMASRVTKRGAPTSGAPERGGGAAPKKAPPPVAQLFAPTASGATGTGSDPDPEAALKPTSVPRWELPPDIAAIEEGAEEAVSMVEAVEEVASGVEEASGLEEASGVEEAVELCVLPTYWLLRKDGEARAAAATQLAIAEVGTHIPPAGFPCPRGLPLEASEANLLESFESRERGAALYAPMRAAATAPPPEACVARSAAEEELVRLRRRTDAMVRSYTQPGQAADGLRLQYLRACEAEGAPPYSYVLRALGSRELRLAHCHLGEGGGVALVSALLQSDALRSLELHDCAPAGRSLLAVASLLSRHELLRGLALTCTRLGAAAAPLARAVAVSALTSLDLSGCSLGDEAGARLCSCVAQQRPRRLASLRLARNGLGAATARALAPLLDDLGASPSPTASPAAAAALPPLALALSRLRLIDQPETRDRPEQLGPRAELRAAAVAGRRFAARHGGSAALDSDRVVGSDLLRLIGPRDLAAPLTKAAHSNAEAKAQVSKADVRALRASLRAKLAQHVMRVIDLLRGWDADGDGIVSEPEFVKALRALGFKFKKEIAAQLFAEFDADGSGEVDLKELKRKILETEEALEAQREADAPDETGSDPAAAPALTSLDLADNQLGGGALGPLLRVLRGGACALSALDLSRNRLPESMALRLTDTLGANTSLTRLSLASVGLLAAPATALADALRRNGKAGGQLAHLDLRGNPLGSVAMRQLMATLQMSPTLETLMLHDTEGSSGPNGQPVVVVGEGGAPVEFDPSRMEGKYTLDLERPWDAWVGRRLVQEGTQRWTGVTMDGTKSTKHKKWSEPEHLPAKGKLCFVFADTVGGMGSQGLKSADGGSAATKTSVKKKN